MKHWKRSTLLAGCAAALLCAASAFDLGMEAYRARNYAAAIREFEMAVKEQPANAHYQKMLGQVYQEQSGSWKAIDPLRRACALDPREPEACFMLGKIAFRRALFPEALAAYQKAIEIPDGRGASLAGLARTLDALGRTKEAEQRFRQAVDAGETVAQIDLARSMLRQGRVQDSIALLTKAAAAGVPGARTELAREQRMVPATPAHPAADVASAAIRFRESTLDMIVRNGATGDKHLPETMLGGVAVFDYDGDGWPDIFIANGATFPTLRKTDPSYGNRLFRNNHNGTFTDVTARAGVAGEGYSMGVAVGDFDNDGHEDLFVTGVKSNTLYRNRGDGTFEDITTASGLGGELGFTAAAGWFDYDNDGRLDLFVVRYVNWDPARDATCCAVAPGVRQYCHPLSYGPMTNLLYHNEGGGHFRNVSKEAGLEAHPGKGMSVAFGDSDGDGRLEAFVTNDNLPNSFFHNDGNGRFREIALEAGVAYNDDGAVISSMGTDFRDYDNDGREDLFVTALPDELFSLYRGIGPNLFANTTSPSGMARESRPYSGWGTGFYDLNNDGYKDIFVAGGHVLDNAEFNSGRKSRLPNVVFVNHGGGTFKAEALPGDGFYRGSGFGDFNHDGKIDVVVSRLNERPLILTNTTATAGHWIQLRLVGTRSNRDGIGARVHIVTSSGEQWNRVTTAVGYASSSDPILHFGLGGDAEVRTIEIEWPSGTKQKLAGVAADRFLTIRETAAP